ncbi:MAG TPA: cohesin domain-containing protein [Candidatus Polarisedimenticolia bacterium]|nr:cohesin domain-containing protein [Candidatus Polarisedimenticolia bacterium]
MALSGRRRAWTLALAICLVVQAAGCAVSKLHRIGTRSEAAGEYDKAVLAYAKLAAMHPENQRWTISLARAKLKASQVHFEKAKKYKDAGQLELAIGELQQVVTLDPANSYAATELEKAVQEWQKKRALIGQTELEKMKEAAKKTRGAPLLNPRSNIPVHLMFRDAEVGKIYEVLSKATGINFLYDPKLDLKKKVSIELTNVPFEKAMDTLMFTNKHFFKVMDENTIIIADDNQAKRRELEDEVIKTFFLSNADVKDVQSLLRTMLDARKVVQNAQLNAITIRDTPNKIAIAQKIIEANDKAKAELIVDVELLEISRTVSKTLGINLTPRQYTVQWTGPDRLPLNNLGLLNQLGLYSLGPIPQVTIDFLKSDSGTRTIAKPQLRVTEGEKANLHIGDSVPIPTTTFNTTGTVGGSVLPITSFTYQEVGIVIEIEPRVHHNREVTLKLNVEVSQLGERVDAGQGVSQPSINTRQINTIIRLKDGESNLLAGLIRDDGTSSKSGFPGLMDVPGLSRIFSSQTDTRRETDLVLTLTPHIIRIPDLRPEDLEALFIGSESNPKLRGEAGSVFATPFTPDAEEDEEGEEEEAAAETSPTDPNAPRPGPATGAAQPQDKPVSQPPGSLASPPIAPDRPVPSPAGELDPEEEGIEEDDLPAEQDDPGSQPAAPAPVPGQPPDAAPAQPGGAEAEAAPAQAGPMNLTIAPARLNVVPGGTFSLNLLVNNVTGLQKVSFTLTYDPATVDFDSALEGIIMKQDGTQTLFTANKTGDGQVAIEVTRQGGAAGISRGGALAAVRFRALAAGRTRIGFGPVHAETFDGGTLQVNSVDAEITVN